MKTKIFIIIALLGSVIYFSKLNASKSDGVFHSSAEMKQFQHLGIDGADSPIFKTSNICGGCHGFDPSGIATHDTLGNDINLYDDWRTSMMGLAAIDPFWRAKVAHEVSLLPQYKKEIEETCLTCHAPMGHYLAQYRNEEYLFQEFYQDSLGLDGVSCLVCHTISKDGLGKTFSGQINMDTSRVAYGPYPFPFDGPMTSFIGFKPTYASHIDDSELCAGCHTLITGSFDLDGNPTGSTFVEQATYHEWLNSYYKQNNTECESCHMDAVLQPVIVASGIRDLSSRSFYTKHNLLGANKQMISAIRANAEYLGLDIPDSLFAESVERVTELLQKESVKIELYANNSDDQQLEVSFKLTNLVGHKFPSGYPTRRAYLEFSLLNSSGERVFHSGERIDNRLTGHDVAYESHYDIISNEDQVQIYEMVFVDSDNQVTDRLNQAIRTIKDNRLVPRGFLQSHPSYDTVRLVGAVVMDSNFNYDDDGVEGSGTDIISYRIDMTEYGLSPDESYTAILNMWYESFPSRTLDAVLNSGIPQADTLQHVLTGNMSPTLVGSIEIDTIHLTVGNTELAKVSLSAYPNPARNSIIVDLPSYLVGSTLEFYSINGKYIDSHEQASKTNPIDLRAWSKGTYFCIIRNAEGRITNSIKFIKE